MISDVLSEAIHEIQRYREEMPEVYGGMDADLERVISEMERVRIALDTPPTVSDLYQ